MAMHLRASGTAISAGGRTLIRGLDFVLDSGDVVEIVGENGIGKSTLLRTLAGLVDPFEGEIERPESLNYLGHRAGIVGVMTPIENLRHAAALVEPRASRDDIHRALARLGLWSSRRKPCHSLSAGQQRRVGLAGLTVGQHRVWLLDEPTTSLDAAGIALVAELIDEHREGGGSVVAAIHGSLGVNARRLDLNDYVDAPD